MCVCGLVHGQSPASSLAIESYIVQLKLNEPFAEFETIATVAASESNYTITTLSPMKRFFVRLIATNAAGQSAPSGLTALYTPPDAPCPQDCNHRGSCFSSQCVCETEWAGPACELPTKKACFQEDQLCFMWAFDGDDVHVHMAARTHGWFGVILDPEDNGMTNGDAIIASVSAGGGVSVVDSYSRGYEKPYADEVRML